MSDSPAFEIPLSNVSQCATGKNEVTLEFHQNDDAEVALMEVRFYVPPGTGEEGTDPVEVCVCLGLATTIPSYWSAMYGHPLIHGDQEVEGLSRTWFQHNLIKILIHYIHSDCHLPNLTVFQFLTASPG